MKNVQVRWSFWVIGLVLLIWNLLGCINFVMQLNPDVISAYAESEQSIIRNRPIWATSAFAVAVFGGALGCLLLLFKNSLCVPLFWSSLAGVVITMLHTLSLDISFSAGQWIGIIFMPIAIALFLITYSKYQILYGALKR